MDQALALEVDAEPLVRAFLEIGLPNVELRSRPNCRSS